MTVSFNNSRTKLNFIEIFTKAKDYKKCIYVKASLDSEGRFIYHQSKYAYTYISIMKKYLHRNSKKGTCKYMLHIDHENKELDLAFYDFDDIDVQLKIVNELSPILLNPLLLLIDILSYCS
jgi:hypothetical protein